MNSSLQQIKYNHKIIRAMALGIGAALSYSIMNMMVKLVAHDTTESMTVFFRFMVSLFWVIAVLIYKHLRGDHFPVRTKHFGLHLLRAVCSFSSILALYYALKYVPLVDANSLAMTYTLFIPILSMIFLGTTTSFKSWLTLIVGFIGIILILKPYGNSFNPIVLLALISGFATAASFLGVHELAKDDKPYTIMLYFFPLTFIFSGIFSIFNWQLPTPTILVDLLLIGVAGTIYQELLTRALLHAPPNIVSPILYFSVIFSGIFDWIFWQHVPDLYFWFGTTLVGFGCIFSIKYANANR